MPSCRTYRLTESFGLFGVWQQLQLHGEFHTEILGTKHSKDKGGRRFLPTAKAGGFLAAFR